MTSDPYAESTHEVGPWANRKEEGSKPLVSILARLAGLVMLGGYIFTVAAVAIIVPALIIWSFVG